MQISTYATLIHAFHTFACPKQKKTQKNEKKKIRKNLVQFQKVNDIIFVTYIYTQTHKRVKWVHTSRRYLPTGCEHVPRHSRVKHPFSSSFFSSFSLSLSLIVRIFATSGETDSQIDQETRPLMLVDAFHWYLPLTCFSSTLLSILRIYFLFLYERESTRIVPTLT